MCVIMYTNLNITKARLAHLGPDGPRWVACWPHEPCYLGGFWKEHITYWSDFHGGHIYLIWIAYHHFILQHIAPHQKQFSEEVKIMRLPALLCISFYFWDLRVIKHVYILNVYIFVEYIILYWLPTKYVTNLWWQPTWWKDELSCFD